MIDLFAGIGGIRLGFERVFGVDAATVFISEIDKHSRDREVNERLAAEGRTVLRFFGRQIKKNVDECVRVIAQTVAQKKSEAGKCPG